MYAASQNLLSSASYGMQILHAKGGQIIFNDYIEDTPFTYLGIQAQNPTPKISYRFGFLAEHDSLGHFRHHNVLRYNSDGEAYPKMLGPKKNGNFYYTGATDNSNNALLYELDSGGNLVWNKILYAYNGVNSNGTTLFNTAIDDSENLYFVFCCHGDVNILGKNLNYSTDSNFILIVKADSAGNMIWYKPFCNWKYQSTQYSYYPGIYSNIEPVDVKIFIDHSGCVHFWGNSAIGLTIGNNNHQPKYQNDILVGKLNPDGSLAWNSFFDANFNTIAINDYDHKLSGSLDDSANLFIQVFFKGNATFGKVKLAGTPYFFPCHH